MAEPAPAIAPWENTMRPALLVALLGIATLFAGSLAFIAWSTGGAPLTIAPPRVQDGARAAGAAAAAPLPPWTPAAPGPITEPAPVGAAPAVDTPPPRRPRPPGTLSRVQQAAPRAERRSLASFRLELKAGMAELQKRIAHCAGEADRGLGGIAPGGDAGLASFVLDVETVQGGLRIVEARREAGGSDAAVDCAQTTLRGHVIPAPSAAPGRRWQMPFALGAS
jgi:hypothetical protein